MSAVATSVSIFHCKFRQLWRLLVYHINLRLVGFLASFLLSCTLVYIMVSIIIFKNVLTWFIFVSYLVLYIFCSQCLSRWFLKEFSVPTNIVLGGKLFQFSVYYSVSTKTGHSKNCLVV